MLLLSLLIAFRGWGSPEDGHVPPCSVFAGLAVPAVAGIPWLCFVTFHLSACALAHLQVTCIAWLIHSTCSRGFSIPFWAPKRHAHFMDGCLVAKYQPFHNYLLENTSFPLPLGKLGTISVNAVSGNRRALTPTKHKRLQVISCDTNLRCHSLGQAAQDCHGDTA